MDTVAAMLMLVEAAESSGDMHCDEQKRAPNQLELRRHACAANQRAIAPPKNRTVAKAASRRRRVGKGEQAKKHGAERTPVSSKTEGAATSRRTVTLATLAARVGGYSSSRTPYFAACVPGLTPRTWNKSASLLPSFAAVR